MKGDVLLIVEDEVDLRESIVRLLTAQGYEVLQANHGKEALLLIRARAREATQPQIKVILSDWMMEEMNGIELLNELRKSPYRHIAFVLMSGAVTKEALKDAMVHDPDSVLLKPFEGSTLLKKIEEAISVRQKKGAAEFLASIDSSKPNIKR